MFTEGGKDLVEITCGSRLTRENFDVSRSYVSFFNRSIKREKERKIERGRESFLLNSNFESVVDTIRFRIGQIQTLNVTWTKK